MRKPALAVLMISALATAQAAEVREVQDDTLKAFLKGVEVLLNKNDPRSFPAVLRLVSVQVPSTRCNPSAVAEKDCYEQSLHLVLSNWDLYSDVQVFEIGTASRWSVKDLALIGKGQPSLWSATLSLEADVYMDGKMVARTYKFIVNDKLGKYTVEVLGEK